MRGLPLAAAAAVLLAAASPMAAQVSARSAGASWRPPFPAASASLLTALQGYLRTDAGAALMLEAPGLRIVERLSPASPAHLALAGAFGLPTGYEARLEEAVRDGGRAALESAYGVLAAAYRDSEAERRLAAAARERSAELLAAAADEAIDAPSFAAAAWELSPLAGLESAREAVEAVSAAAAERRRGTVIGRAEAQARSLLPAALPAGDALPQAAPARDASEGPGLEGLHDALLPYARGLSDPLQLEALRAFRKPDQALLALDGVRRIRNEHQRDAVITLAKRQAASPELVEKALKFRSRHQSSAFALLQEKLSAEEAVGIAAEVETFPQVQALAVLTSKDIPVLPLAPLAARVSDERGVAALGKFVEGIREVHGRDFFALLAPLGWTGGGLLFALIASDYDGPFWPAMIPFVALTLIQLGWRLARPELEKRRNRRFLDDNPDIEAALGRIDAPELFAARKKP